MHAKNRPTSLISFSITRGTNLADGQLDCVVFFERTLHYIIGYVYEVPRRAKVLRSIDWTNPLTLAGSACACVTNLERISGLRAAVNGPARGKCKQRPV